MRCYKKNVNNMNIKINDTKVYIGSEIIGKTIGEIDFTETKVEYDKHHFPISSLSSQEFVFDCSSVRINPLFDIIVRYEALRLRKQKEIMKPKWIHCQFRRGELIEFLDNTQKYWRIY